MKTRKRIAKPKPCWEGTKAEEWGKSAKANTESETEGKIAQVSCFYK